MERSQTAFCIWAVVLSCLGACRPTSAPLADPGPGVVPPPGPVDFFGPIRPIPVASHLDARRVALGRRLFLDPHLSQDDSIACATCHPLGQAGVDGLPRSIGIRGQVSSFNTPTVYNAALNFRQFWDGRIETLEEQVRGPIENPRELGSNLPAVIAKIERDPTYVRQTAEAYGGPMTAVVLADAIATFERSLTLPGSRFDRFLAGDTDSLDADELRGYELFKSHGCTGCHQGINVGGNMFERFGVARDYFAELAHPSPADLGRFNVTGREEDRHVFRVPSLRLVSLTSPYLHDGSVPVLEQMIRLMARYQLGTELVTGDVKAIEKFLGTLVGSFDGVTFASVP